MSERNSRKIFLIFGLITTIAAVVGIIFGLQTLGGAANSLDETKKADQGNLILNLNRDFFFDDRLLKVRQAIENNDKILKENQGQLTDQDLDDYLGMFEMMDGLRERKILDASLLEDNFCIFVDEAYSNKEITTYISQVRKDLNDTGIYSGFENLAKNICK